jgi:hypothetical protein
VTAGRATAQEEPDERASGAGTLIAKGALSALLEEPGVADG